MHNKYLLILFICINGQIESEILAYKLCLHYIILWQSVLHMIIYVVIIIHQ